ncbi:MAG: hypothetical protein JW801_08160 [Bacteroidales bacterium]|nr:hypothetical protein [Bacteroidales bacterium]
MKSDQYSVCELDRVELENTSGGYWWIVVTLVGNAIWDSVTNPSVFMEGYKEGYAKASTN